MTVDPVTRALIDEMSKQFPDVVAVGAVEARAQHMERTVEVEPVHEVVDRTIPGPAGQLPVRIYRPSGGELPVVVFFHGGGWVLCGLDTHDGLCRSLANGAGVVVVSVDYRLAPEHRYPGPLDDACASTAWVAANGPELGVDVRRLAVAGDSAGGNLAAAVCLRARDQGGPPIAFQLLVYPVLAHAFDSDSYVDNAEGYFLTAEHMRWYWSQYLADPADGKQAYASPLYADDLAGLPPAHIVTGEHDPLRDEGEAYANRLRAAGVSATSVRYGGMFHGFFSMGAYLPAAGQAAATAHAAVRQALSASGGDRT